MSAWSPLVIIGAPRSGTNMLRDLICGLPGFHTWPCDEINYIWRHGNARWPSDVIPRAKVTDKVRRYIRKRFDQIARDHGGCVVVEKTCANSLRVPFVDAILPEAKYLFIVRDGVDAVYSAIERWKAGMEYAYLLRKARYVPVTDIPYYFSKFIANRFYKLYSGQNRLAFWGPRLENMTALLSEMSIEEVCALQWQACVNESRTALNDIEANRVCDISYEKLVSNPESEMRRIGNFLGISEDDVKYLDLSKITADSIGKGRRQFNADVLARVEGVISESLRLYGYE